MESSDVKPEPPNPGAAPLSRGLVASQYEFTDADNAIFSRLAWNMNFVGLFTLAIGLFVIGTGVFLHHAGTILSGALYALMGLWTHRASVSFRDIAQTSGRDVSHLMHALRDLTRLYTLMFWLSMLSLIAGIGTLVLFLIWT